MALSKLTPAELSKKNSSTGEQRIDILENAIKKGIALPLVDGSEVVLANSKENLDAVNGFKTAGKAFDLKVKTGQRVIKSSDIGKSPLFGGGGGGAGGGTQQTAIVESMQCVYLQAMLDNPNKNIEFFTPSVLKKAYAKCEVGGTTFDEIRDFDPSWHMSAFLSAQIIIKNGYVNKNQVFHRDSNTMKKIYAMKKEAFKNSGLDILTDDKWNPGDIWAIDKSFNVSKELPDDTVNTLNQALIKHFNDRRLVGISLKGPETKYPPPLKEFNNQYPPDAKIYKYRGVLLQGAMRGDFWSSKSGTIKFDGGEMNLKDNANGEVVKAEIKGKNARGGGLSWGPMSDFIQRETRKKLPPFKSGIFGKAKRIEKGDLRAIKLFWGMYNHFYKNDSFEDFVKNLETKDKFWISAKLGVIYVCYIIDKIGGRTADNIVTHFVNYAGSRSTDASVYVKVGK